MTTLDAEFKLFLERAVRKYEMTIETVIDYLERRGVDPDAAREYRLGSVSEAEPGHEVGQGRLSIPYLTPTGVVALKFRCVSDHDCKEHGHPKYVAPKGQRARLYNVAAFAADTDYIGIAEGELDALILSRYCQIPAVGVPGAGNWKTHQHWPRMFSGFRRVLVFADPDKAGAELANRITDSLSQAQVVELPSDVNATYLEKGPEAVRHMAGLP